MFKTIEEITRDAEFAKVMVDHYAGSEEHHRQEALKDAVARLMWQRERDELERQLITANGEAS